MSTKNSSGDYAGDISPADAWDILQKDPKAQLVDVRTTAEWNYVGLPDLSSVGREAALVEWQSFPSMRPNPSFVADTERATAVAKDTPLLFLCRSGVRSRGAATLASEHGYQHCFDILEGFEGDKDEHGHRKNVNGWCHAGLPWIGA
jgi:rhodanese-related sulfurtransferase